MTGKGGKTGRGGKGGKANPKKQVKEIDGVSNSTPRTLFEMITKACNSLN